MPAVSVVRRRLEAQGFLGLDDVALAEIGPWPRWSPALCALVMATGTVVYDTPFRRNRSARAFVARGA